MYELENLVGALDKVLSNQQEHYLDVSVFTCDDHKNISIETRKANLIQERGRKISLSYPLKKAYCDWDVELIVTKLVEK
ncbi:hypothetical protein [Serratia liquefaciens]|uniref:hypothetical protein n=1 Tax=Serratia liquefaciens TaxID=614 RepID=UPI0003584C35|nr:hypothetical protein [Serratia liquefaciens]AGQ30865.1 hypothetical protein M495_10550 [Serratia liquefaciens ATCC 27592]CAI0844473.1 Uncharacterised protein [Serratia liquefaciens]CAI2077879.1 Uncharacterised protein [Serratia liquefaciens]CAI2446729.1 Uncharacterised protein [Serratia liquefaciens]HBL6728985.1 hypothetical protein [Serratia liquefaciens]